MIEMSSLFTTHKIDLDLKDGDATYYPNFIDVEKANKYFKILLKSTPWQQDIITVYGNTYKQPRLTALFGSNNKPYSYSNITMQPHKFTPELLEIKNAIEKICNVNFTTCLLNLYRYGSDSNGWHSDNEPELGKNPIIASISLGEERFFHFKNKNDKSLKQKILLQHGSLLLMKGDTQHNWLHQLPKTTKNIGERINLTFRIIQ
jgi:alkylated DNA repair dioxygenase AlkB